MSGPPCGTAEPAVLFNLECRRRVTYRALSGMHRPMRGGPTRAGRQVLNASVSSTPAGEVMNLCTTLLGEEADFGTSIPPRGAAIERLLA